MVNNELEKKWNTEDLDFDEQGRLVFKNESLKRWIKEKIIGEPSLKHKKEDLIILGGRCPMGFKCPDVDSGCKDIRIRFMGEEE